MKLPFAADAVQSATPTPGSTSARRRSALVAVVTLLVFTAVLAAAIVVRQEGRAVGAARPAAGTRVQSAARAAGEPAGLPAARAEIEEKVQAVLREAEQLDRTVWAREVEAQRYEEFFIGLWDEFRAAGDKLAVLETAPFDTLSFSTAGGATSHDWDITLTRFDGAQTSVDRAGWHALIDGWRDAGYRATELEFHQSEFVHDPPRAARSTVATVVHLVNDRTDSRQVVRCKLKVRWQAEPRGGSNGGGSSAGAGGNADASAGRGTGAVVPPRAIEVTDLTIASRTGDVAFEPVALPGAGERGLVTHVSSNFVLAYDLDGDGRSELLIPWENLLLRNRGGFRFEPEPLLPRNGDRGIPSAVVADFDGDGLPDLLCTSGGNLCVARGVAGGRFAAGPPRLAASLSFKAHAVTVLTAGDIDGDGDLDAWLGQYRPPYEGGQMPTPYYDANDGYPAALLVNDGAGRFVDGTEAAGVASRRFRRTFAASFIDLDGDRDLDLLVNSDFSGLDIYFNDGKGRFTDVTEQVVDERHNFGMGHTFADFNLDGRLDVYTIGMSSTTARRLTAMNAGRQEFPGHQEKRPQMGYGNRMFLAPAAHAAPGQPTARYVQPMFRDDIARTGWSWGATSPDFDNDGDPDVFVGNGMISGTTCRDYCSTYWRRDIYLGSSREDPVMNNLFMDHGIPQEVSWNGFEHDVLFMNEGGRGFINIAHLMGVAFEFDTRNVISDDLDGDGRMDLVVVEREWRDQGRHVHVLKNRWPTKYNWVGVTLAETRPGFSPIGAEVRVRTAGGVQVARVVTGDSFTCQHANAKHFGVGGEDAIESIEVTWPNGELAQVPNPAVNTWHAVRPAAQQPN